MSQSPLLIERQEQTERVILFIGSLVRSLCKLGILLFNFADEKCV